LIVHGVNMVYLAASMIGAFAIAMLGTKAWLRLARNAGFTARDMNKPGGRTAVRAGGLPSVISIAFALMFYEVLQTYIGGYPVWLSSILAVSLLLILSALLGFVDDMLGWKKGLSPRYRILLMAPISLPLVVIKAGVSTLDLPLIGVVDFGLLYPLLLVPIGVLGAANAFNMLAGYNGLEAGMALLLLAYTAVYSYLEGIGPVLLASLVGVAAILGFLIYNWYPARTFPGNNFTYAMGAYYASLVILGNFEKFGLAMFTLYFAELALYLRGLKDGVSKENFGVPREDGTLEPPYPKVYSVTHLAIILLRRLKGSATEKEVVLLILALQAVIGAVSLALFT